MCWTISVFGSPLNVFNYNVSFLQDDIFRCNVKQCICPKFVEARKILDHLERTHSSITQGKTTEQLIRGGFLILPKNLEVHSCYYCNISFAGQPLDRWEFDCSTCNGLFNNYITQFGDFFSHLPKNYLCPKPRAISSLDYSIWHSFWSFF